LRGDVAGLAFGTHGQLDQHVVAGHAMQGNVAMKIMTGADICYTSLFVVSIQSGWLSTLTFQAY